MKFNWWKQLLFDAVILLFLPVFLLAALLPSRRRELLVWGSVPIISNRYWSEAMKEAGFQSMTIMTGTQAYDTREQFDWFFEDFAPKLLPGRLRWTLGANLAFLFLLRRGKFAHLSFIGFVLGYSTFWRLEAPLLRLAGVKTVVIPFGADGYMVSRVIDTTLRYALLAARPDWARTEHLTTSKAEYWMRHADVLVGSLMVDGIGRWDVTTNQPIAIDTCAWEAKIDHNDNDGQNGPVKVLHTPSSRGFKGTEYVIDAVERLRAEGLQVELILMEGVPNNEVRAMMRSADILAEQFLAIGYGISGLEGLASGLAVMCNLEHEAYTRVFRRFGFLNECPILSTTPETLTDNLRALVTDPVLRRRLGAASRAFAEKYQSYEMARYMFGLIYDRLDGKNVDIMAPFHPLMSQYNRRFPRIEHGLIENRLVRKG